MELFLKYLKQLDGKLLLEFEVFELDLRGDQSAQCLLLLPVDLLDELFLLGLEKVLELLCLLPDSELYLVGVLLGLVHQVLQQSDLMVSLVPAIIDLFKSVSVVIQDFICSIPPKSTPGFTLSS